MAAGLDCESKHADKNENANSCRQIHRLYKEDFKEIDEVVGIINDIKNVYNDLIPTERCYDRISFILDGYQQQPHLLDSHLESLIAQILNIVRDPDSPDGVLHIAFRYLYLITKVRGYKNIVRMLPHEVADLEPVLELLTKQDLNNWEVWETRYMLLLWLSIVSMIPFDLVRLDSNIRLQTGETKQPIMERIIDAAKKYLDVNEKSRDAAAYMLSRFMTRPDVKKEQLPQFLDWMLTVLKTADRESKPGTNAITGMLTTLALLLKNGKREDMVTYTVTILHHVAELSLQNSVNTVLRKLHMKLVQRVGLTFLKARQAAWRYQRGSRSLADNLTEKQTAMSGLVQTAPLQDEDEDYDIPDEIEDVLELLLSGLKDKDTIVRWSAAKGIGRITGRLPRELADEVVGSLMELFTGLESDTAWHGGCLALAELGRRGLLLPARLPDVIPVIVKALNYDEKRGNYSVGAHVRDAGCYVCWSFARAYDPEEMLPHVTKIARALVIVSVFDREVNVRRAAAAAFQENVGRQGQFPHGIDILTTCDYFAVGNLTSCYTELSKFVGQFPEYIEALIDHLVNVKISHWDSEIRKLTAHALHNLTDIVPEHMASIALPNLLSKTSSLDLFERHGSIIATAEVIHGLFKVTQKQNKGVPDMVSKSCIDGVRNIAKQLSDAKLFKGMSGELMRIAVCWLINKVSLSKMPYHEDTVIIDLWLSIINEGLDHIVPEVQAASISAIPGFVSEYYKQADGKQRPEVKEKIIDRYLKGLTSGIESERMGNALALGALPKFILQSHLEVLIGGLIQGTTVTKKYENWTEARRDAVLALTRVCCEVGVAVSGNPEDVVCTEALHKVYTALFTAMQDYTLDSRGDVGAWVRKAAMSSLFDLTSTVVKTDSTLISADLCKRVFCCLVQQAVEKIDGMRALAGELFRDLLYHSPEIPHIPHREELKAIFQKVDPEDMNWALPSSTFPLFGQLLSLTEYRYHVLLGLTVSVGGITESLVKHSSSSLLLYLRGLSHENQSKLDDFAALLLSVFRDHLKVTRVSVPMFKMLDLLLANNVFSSFSDDPNHKFPLELLNLCRQEISKSGDVQKLLASVDVFCGMLQFTGEVKSKVLFSLSILLCHRYPKVRKTAADKLYEAILTYEGTVEEEAVDVVMTLLSETIWDSTVDEVKPIRNEISELMKIPLPKVARKNKED